MEATKQIFQFFLIRSFKQARHLLSFCGGSVSLLLRTLRSAFTPPFHFSLLVDQCFSLGIRSSFLVFITALSTGFVMSLQFGYGLERFGGKLYVPKIVGMSIMRELGPVLTCLMLAGRVGSGIAAEVGSMNVTQQIDAIRALGTDPIKRIVIPRVLAMLIMAPILTVFADLVGILGGLIIALTELNISASFYIYEGLTSLKLADFTLGISKTFLFGLLISLTGCYYGLNTTGGTQGVGRATNHAVVTSSVLIVIFDFILTKLFWIFEKT
jgi:phospholipid/cholesterol/gamma-HCH transport system permease protein